jgi:hypothetical protein
MSPQAHSHEGPITKSVYSLSRRLEPFRADMIKGAATLVVVADHNDIFRQANTGLDRYFQPLTIHVLLFFIVAIPGAYLSTGNARSFVSKRFFKYFIPFSIFYSLYFLATSLYGARQTNIDLYIQGLLLGSFDAVKLGCGGAFMWFLPALIGFSYVIYGIARLDSRYQYLVLTLSAALSLYAPYLSDGTKHGLPLGLGVVSYCLFPLLVSVLAISVWDKKINSRSHGRKIFVLLFMIFAATHYVLAEIQGEIEIGAISGPGYLSPLTYITYLISISAGALFFLYVPITKGMLSRCICAIGAHSLFIYLTHPFIQKMIVSAMAHKPLSLYNNSIAEGVFLWIITVLLSFLASKTLNKIILTSMVIPPKFRRAEK